MSTFALIAIKVVINAKVHILSSTVSTSIKIIRIRIPLKTIGIFTNAHHWLVENRKFSGW